MSCRMCVKYTVYVYNCNFSAKRLEQLARPVIMLLHIFLGAFAESRKVSFMFVCPYVRINHCGSHWTDLAEI